jgi:hypothetical protein
MFQHLSIWEYHVRNTNEFHDDIRRIIHSGNTCYLFGKCCWSSTVENTGNHNIQKKFADCFVFVWNVICCLLRNPKFHYRVRKIQPHALSWARLIQSAPYFITPYFSKIHFNIIVLFCVCVSEIIFLSGFRQKCCRHFSSPPCVPHIPLILSLNLITLIIFGEE